MMGPSKSFINRADELQRLAVLSDRPGAKIVVMYGRRRVGKTALLERAFANRGLLKFEGLEGISAEAQRKEFLRQLLVVRKEPLLANLPTDSWSKLLEQVTPLLARGKKRTLYLEEFQWLASYDSELLSALKYFWDNEWATNPNFMLVLCGSAPSFMVHHVLRSRALYNRSEIDFAVMPFDLTATRSLLGPRTSLYEAMDALLAVGGIPPYLTRLTSRGSVYTSLVHESFLPGAYFASEYDRIFTSTFGKRREYRAIVEILSKGSHLDRQQIASKLGRQAGGSLSLLLDDLELSGFITSYNPVGKDRSSKLKRYVVIDPYVRLYNRAIKPVLRKIHEGAFRNNPALALPMSRYRTLLGFAFERWVLANQHRLAEILQFAGIEYASGPYFDRSAPGVQVDLVFERGDRVTTLVEVKYSDRPVGVEILPECETKAAIYPLGRRSLQRVLVSAAGANEALQRSGYFDRIIDLKQLAAH